MHSHKMTPDEEITHPLAGGVYKVGTYIVLCAYIGNATQEKRFILLNDDRKCWESGLVAIEKCTKETFLMDLRKYFHEISPLF